MNRWLQRNRDGLTIVLLGALAIAVALLIIDWHSGSQPLEIRLPTPIASPATTQTPFILVNINTASKDLLESLPAIGEVYAQRIIDSRVANGDFASTEELVSRNVISQGIFEKIRSSITVGP